MEDIYEGSDGWTAMGALEGQLAGRQGRYQAAALISVQAVIEFDRPCLMHTCIHLSCMKISVLNYNLLNHHCTKNKLMDGV